MSSVKTKNVNNNNNDTRKTRVSLYRTVWRWHFYAGIIFAPFLIILAVSGAVYLFKPQIESLLYHNQYYVQETEAMTLSPTAQIVGVEDAYPNGTVSSITFYDDLSRTTKISLLKNEETYSIFVNPYTGDLTGKLKDEDMFTEVFKKIHSELLVGGTIANRWVELTACWAFILLLTGLYVWWPRNKSSIWGTVLPRLKKKGRTFWRDLHAVPAFWLALFISLQIVTGLPWSGIMGEQISRLATSTDTGYPPYATIFDDKPESNIKTEDVADNVPWGAKKLPVPASNMGDTSLSVNKVLHIAENQNIDKPFTIHMPEGAEGVYTIATENTGPSNTATLHIDQYSGAILSDVRFADYGIMAKGITMGIALHEGRLFGLANQLIGLIVCVGLIAVIISAFVMWIKRKPSGELGPPPKVNDKKITRGVFFIMIALGLLMPLVGISIIIIYLLDRFVFLKIKPLRSWLY